MRADVLLADEPDDFVDGLPVGRIHINVVDGDTVQVSGLSPQQVIERLTEGHRGEHRTIVSDGPGHYFVDVAQLSRREREVVHLIAMGRSNEGVAAALFLSANTVKSYIRSAYRKMGVTGRSQAVVWAVHHGLARKDDA